MFSRGFKTILVLKFPVIFENFGLRILTRCRSFGAGVSSGGGESRHNEELGFYIFSYKIKDVKEMLLVILFGKHLVDLFSWSVRKTYQKILLPSH